MLPSGFLRHTPQTFVQRQRWVGACQSRYDFELFACGTAVMPMGEGSLLIVGVDHVDPALANGLLKRLARKCFPGGDRIDHLAIGSHCPHNLRRHVNQGPKSLFTIA